MKKILSIITLSVLVSMTAQLSWAGWNPRSYRQHPGYLVSQDLVLKARSTNEYGDYDQAVSLAQDAQGQMDAVSAWLGVVPYGLYTERWAQTARTELSLARPADEDAYAEPKDPQARWYSNIVRALTAYTVGTNAFSNAESTWEAVSYSNGLSAAIAAFSNSIMESRHARDAQARWKLAHPGTESMPAERSAFYVVRLLPGDRDCFWKIAGYPFVYGNSTEWKRLYEANRGLLQDPGNPDLIQPGMKFFIPSIAGEQRSGFAGSNEVAGDPRSPRE
jgi:hypothetical protein